MAIPNSTFRAFIQKLGNSDPSTFVGNEGDIFWDPNTGELKVSDGSTPGGVAVTGGGGGGASQSYVDNKVGLATAGLASETYVLQQIGITTIPPLTQSLIPDADDTYDLGSPTKQWRELYVTSNTMYVGGVPIGVDTDGRLTVNKEPLAKLAELNEDRIEVSENDIETLKVKNNHFESLVGIASARIEELQDAIIMMQGVYNGQIETLTNKLTALPKTVHASWDSSNGSKFDWTTDQISSSGVTDVTRVNKGVYRISFSEDFSSTNYTVTTGCGSKDYGGGLLAPSPRVVSVLFESRTASSVDVICERSDDAVNEDNDYMSIIIMGVSNK